MVHMHSKGYGCCLVYVRVCVCVCVCVCVTANLGIYAKRCQMMGTNGISSVWRSLKKKVFSLKIHRPKVRVFLLTSAGAAIFS